MARLVLHPETSIGPVHLSVSDRDRVLDFYCNVLGFKTLDRRDDTTWLSADGITPLLGLTFIPGAKRKPAFTTGLYHFAILLPSRLELARCLHHVLQMRYPLQGAAHHLVSEAIYLADPDGNGIEVYADRPRDEWPWRGSELEMVTNPLDLDYLLAELGRDKATWDGLSPATRIGHVHLHVADLKAARAFYHDVLGFNQTASYGLGAVFVSAGGYHHHIGLNTWVGEGAHPPPEDVVGMRYFTICLRDYEELSRLMLGLRKAGIGFNHHGALLTTNDPSMNGIAAVAGEEMIKSEAFLNLRMIPE